MSLTPTATSTDLNPANSPHPLRNLLGDFDPWSLPHSEMLPIPVKLCGLCGFRGLSRTLGNFITF